MRVGLVGCVKTKLDRPAPARDLYTSTLFRGRRAFVEKACDHWYVLSARYGLVSPDALIEPYEQALNGSSAASKRSWSTSVLEQLDGLGFEIRGAVFEIHAGAEYRNFGLVDGLRSRGAVVEVPTAHLSQGQQLAFYGGAACTQLRQAVSGLKLSAVLVQVAFTNRSLITYGRSTPLSPSFHSHTSSGFSAGPCLLQHAVTARGGRTIPPAATVMPWLGCEAGGSWTKSTLSTAACAS